MSAPGDPAPVGVIGGAPALELLARPRRGPAPTALRAPPRPPAGRRGPPAGPPWGPRPAPAPGGAVGGPRARSVPRQGRDPGSPPHRVNYRANVWALRAVGVRQVLAPCAVGSLRPDLPAGSFV